jgi:hypothetical protein
MKKKQYSVYGTEDGLLYFTGLARSRRQALSRAIVKFQVKHKKDPGWFNNFDVIEQIRGKHEVF